MRMPGMHAGYTCRVSIVPGITETRFMSKSLPECHLPLVITQVYAGDYTYPACNRRYIARLTTATRTQ